MWPFSTNEDVRSGDLRNKPGHGPLFGWAPKATPADMEQYRAQGSVCACSDCKAYRRG